MMAEHFRAFSAVFPLIMREHEGKKQLLLHRRQNTGYMDGLWDTASSGHVDEGETAAQAAARECREEVGLRVDPADLSFAHLSHRLASPEGRTYYDIYFFVRRFSGVPAVMEPEKCSELSWFDTDDLPEDMIAFRRQDVASCLASVYYSEKCG